MNLETLIEKMKLYGFELGGSRRMAEKFPEYIKLSDSTDWDFYCSNDDKYHDFLNDNGFMKLDTPNHDYWDDFLLEIWKHEEFAIEVLIRTDVNSYKNVFESITPGNFIDNLWKSAPHLKGGINKSQFKANVCARFNQMFLKIDLPF